MTRYLFEDVFRRRKEKRNLFSSQREKGNCLQENSPEQQIPLLQFPDNFRFRENVLKLVCGQPHKL